MYEYVSGNPVKFVDPDGLEARNPLHYPQAVNDENGTWWRLPPRSNVPVSPDFVYNPKRKKIWKTQSKSSMERFYGPNDVICSEKQPICIGGFCGSETARDYDGYGIPYISHHPIRPGAYDVTNNNEERIPVPDDINNLPIHPGTTYPYND